MIPRNIHYCWFGGRNYPKDTIECIKTWKVHLPDYKFFLWNESNAPLDIPFVRQAYYEKKYAFVSDYVRFWAVYNYGGIYLDTDMYLIKTLTPLLDNNIFFAYESVDNVLINGAIFGAEAGNSFLNCLINKYKGLDFNQSLSLIKIPVIITSEYAEFKDKERVKIYNHDYFYPFPFAERNNSRAFTGYATENTYAIHLWNLSWQSKTKKYKVLMRNWIRKVFKI